MNVPVSEAKAQLTELVRRAEAGEEIVLTRRGRPAVRLSPADPSMSVPDPEALAARAERLNAVFAWIKERNRIDPPPPGPSAARSQDFLYDEDGLPA